MDRRHDIDALRVFAFALLILYHVGMVYVVDWGFHIKSPTLLAWVEWPMVLVNRRSASADIPSVTSDDAAGVAMAMQHLVELGHTKIVHLAGPQDLSTGVNRRRAFMSYLEDLHLPAEKGRTVVCETWSEEAGAKAMRTLLDSDLEFTAVLAGNDLLALGVYDALSERGPVTLSAAVRTLEEARAAAPRSGGPVFQTFRGGYAELYEALAEQSRAKIYLDTFSSGITREGEKVRLAGAPGSGCRQLGIRPAGRSRPWGRP